MTQDRNGCITIHHPSSLIAGDLVTVVFEYTVGQSPMAQGGKLRVGLPSVGWSEPLVPQYYFWSEYAQGKDRTYTQYDRVNTTVKLETTTAAVALLESEARFRKPWTFPPNWLRDYDRFWITATIEDDGLNPGDKIVITYGDPQQNPPTARVQRFPEPRMYFLAMVDHDGSGDFHEVSGSPHAASVLPGPTCRMDAIIPSIIRPDQNAQGTLAYTDRLKASPEPKPTIGTIEIAHGDYEPARLSIDGQTDSIRFELGQKASAASRSPLRIRVLDRANELSATSNPALVRSDGHQLFWGDLHGQSQYHGWNPQEKSGMSCNTPRQCYRYARDIAGLDFCSITDTASIAKDIWDDVVQSALEMTEPGRFVAFQGSEGGDNDNGHRNILFVSDHPEPGLSDVGVGKRADLIKQLETPNLHRQFAGRDDVIFVPHHTKMWLDWSCYDPSLEPVLEIYSIWGAGEKPGTDLWDLREMTGGAQEAWSRGYRIGVIAGSDTHAGLPGRSIRDSDRDDFLRFPAGIAGVWASELTRKGIFDALKARRCYGTTGVRIIVEVFLDRQPMGSEVAWPRSLQPRELTLNVWGTDEIETITVIKNNQDIHCFSPNSDQASLVWIDNDDAQAGDYYYLRVIQRDGNRAWTSPIWMD